MTVRIVSEHDDDNAPILADMVIGDVVDDSKWLSIREACKMLGVDQSTLRRWSDSGKVPFFRTPGGHRRYSENVLHRLVGNGSRRFERQRAANRELVSQTQAGFGDSFWRTARERRWYKAYSVSQLEDLRRLGRRLIDLAVRFSTSTAVHERTSLLDDGRQIGRQYGRVSSAAGLNGAESVEAFLYFRAPVVHSLATLTEGNRLSPAALLQVSAEVTSFLDQVLLAMIQEHHDQDGLRLGAIIPTPPERPRLDDA
jgi:excisionase family DNA binding protein